VAAVRRRTRCAMAGNWRRRIKWVNPVGGFEEVAASSINAVQAEANSNDGERAWSETQWRMGQHWRSPIEQREG
jgi:hypothetical protein